MWTLWIRMFPSETFILDWGQNVYPSFWNLSTSGSCLYYSVAKVYMSPKEIKSLCKKENSLGNRSSYFRSDLFLICGLLLYSLTSLSKVTSEVKFLSILNLGTLLQGWERLPGTEHLLQAYSTLHLHSTPVWFSIVGLLTKSSGFDSRYPTSQLDDLGAPV